MRYSGSFILLWCIVVVLAGCQKDNGPDPAKSGFDRANMLTFYADQLIIPGYDSLAAGLGNLKNAGQGFVDQPNSARLQQLRQVWHQTYKRWLKVAPYNFGPAGEAGIRKTLFEEMAVFPVNASKIETIVSTGNFNLNDFNRDARGLGAIEFLLFHPGNDASVLEKFQNQNARNYLVALCQHAEDRVKSVQQAWKSTYRSEFVSNVGTDAGSSTSLLYNEFVKSFEALKNFRLGLPMGNRPGQPGPEPHLAEAFYAQKSVEYMRLHFETIVAVWEGQSSVNGSIGPGFKAYLDKVEGGKALITSTQEQIALTAQALKEIPDDKAFSELLTTRHPKLGAAYTQLQKQTRFFKSDMSSLLGIAITYSSGDGD